MTPDAPTAQTRKIQHVCGLSGYWPSPPHNDPICSACLLRFKQYLRPVIEACLQCSDYRLCDTHYKLVEDSPDD